MTGMTFSDDLVGCGKSDRAKAGQADDIAGA
jgi:hypothetical protein